MADTALVAERVLGVKDLPVNPRTAGREGRCRPTPPADFSPSSGWLQERRVYCIEVGWPVGFDSRRQSSARCLGLDSGGHSWPSWNCTLSSCFPLGICSRHPPPPHGGAPGLSYASSQPNPFSIQGSSSHVPALVLSVLTADPCPEQRRLGRAHQLTCSSQLCGQQGFRGREDEVELWTLGCSR